MFGYFSYDKTLGRYTFKRWNGAAEAYITTICKRSDLTLIETLDRKYFCIDTTVLDSDTDPDITR